MTFILDVQWQNPAIISCIILSMLYWNWPIIGRKAPGTLESDEYIILLRAWTLKMARFENERSEFRGK